MRHIHRELTKDEYIKLLKMTYQEQHDWLFPDGIPVAWKCGYGYYGHKIKKIKEHYCATFTIGDSCD